MKQAIILTAVLGLGMSTIYVLPPFEQVDSALDTTIPERIGSILTSSYPPSEAELRILEADTKFSKAACGMPRTEEQSAITGEVPYDRLDVSIVLSGHDLANSIHRPERCLEAQGHRIQSSSQSEITLSNGEKVPLTFLATKLSGEFGPEGNKQFRSIDNLNCYFFVGHDRVTSNHNERTIIDIRDRVLKGEAQRWAFVSITMQFVDQEERGYGDPPDLEMADKKIRELAKELAERNIDWERIRS
ncbi:exosortase-associated EpsI family protein [Haloferula chungangensis]|uniref:Exosortase-associated EpsI family protein n=1 Tax=Haloferula chungangensis TaxID=1048331 RepID=A0ABW2L6N7_9BACT